MAPKRQSGSADRLAVKALKRDGIGLAGAQEILLQVCRSLTVKALKLVWTRTMVKPLTSLVCRPLTVKASRHRGEE
jgi:hypothetical protein